MIEGCGKDWSFELIKLLYKYDTFANKFQLKNTSLDNKSVKWIQKLGKIFLYKTSDVKCAAVIWYGVTDQIYVLQNSKSTFLWKDYFIKAAGLDLYDILFPHAFEINILIWIC